jgi:hypothetical protein
MALFSSPENGLAKKTGKQKFQKFPACKAG